MSATPPASLAALATTLYHCADCSYCVDAVWAERGIDHVCPTLRHHAPVVSYSGRGYIAAARAWLEGAELDPATLGERVFTCTTCGHCDAVCPIGLRPTAVLHALRGELLQRAQAPEPVTALLAAWARDGNPNRVAGRADWAQGLDIPASGEVLYLPGCAAATARPAEARAAWRILGAGGRAVTTLGAADACCGAPWRELGADDEAEGRARTLAAKCETSGAAIRVTSGQECLRSYAAGAAPVVTFHAWVLAALEDGSLRLAARAPLPRAVALLDSCQHREGEGAATLRALLERLGVNVVNADAVARHVMCCGAGGGMPALQPASAARMAAARVAAFDEAGCDAVVGADPRCVAHLAASATRPVYGIAEFLAEFFEAGT